MKLEFCRQTFEKYSAMKSHEVPSSLSGVVPCGQIDLRTDRQSPTDMTKLVVALLNFANASKTTHELLLKTEEIKQSKIQKNPQ